MSCRTVLDFHGFFGPIHAGGSLCSNGAPIHSRSLHTHPQSPCITIPPYWSHARRDRRGIAVGLRRRPPCASVALRQFTKNCKVRNPTSRKPHTAAHASQILTASDSHTGHVPIRFRGSPIQPPSSKNPDIGFDKTSVSGPTNQASAGLHKFPASPTWRGIACPDGASSHRDQRPASTNLRVRPASSNSPHRSGPASAPTSGGAAACYGLA